MGQIYCFVDGSKRPAGACAAVAIFEDHEEVYRTVKPVDINTSSVCCEAEAILLAVNICMFANFDNPIIYTDSQTICDQFSFDKNIRSRHSYAYLHTLWSIYENYNFELIAVSRKEVIIPHTMCQKWVESFTKSFSENNKKYT